MEVPSQRATVPPKPPEYLLDPSKDGMSPVQMLDLIEKRGTKLRFYTDGSDTEVYGPLKEGQSVRLMVSARYNVEKGEIEQLNFADDRRRVFPKNSPPNQKLKDGELKEWVVLWNDDVLVDEFRRKVIEYSKHKNENPPASEDLTPEVKIHGNGCREC